METLLLLPSSIWVISSRIFRSSYLPSLNRLWVVDAAIAWKGYGTRVMGYDMVDISKRLLPWVVKHDIKNNVKFVRGNLYVFPAVLFYQYYSYLFLLVA